ADLTGRPNQTRLSGETARPKLTPEPTGLPPFDVLTLLRRQLAEADEPWELSAAEIAALPRAGDAPPPELDEVPWWLSEEFTGTDAELAAAFARSWRRLSRGGCRLISGLGMGRARGRGGGGGGGGGAGLPSRAAG